MSTQLEKDIQTNKLELLGKLAAIFSHEIRNPLSVLKLNVQYLRTSGYSFENEVHESLEACEDAVERIQNLVEELLLFSRRSNDDEAAVNMESSITHALQLLDPTIKKNKLTISASLKPLPPIAINKNKLLQVLLNLLTNAIEASTCGGEIAISSVLKKHEGRSTALISIRDFGEGIPDDMHDKLFKEFFTGKKQGTGLGLFVCKQILHEYKGDIAFESKKGKGTTFTLTLPISQKERYEP